MIIIHQHTKISEVIKAEPTSIDAIAAIAEPFRKLKNPLLRRLLASRVTIAAAAAIGGVGVDDFIKALTPLGFQFSDDDSVLTGPAKPAPVGRPDWLTVATEQNQDIFDVRGLIESGKDPLRAILERYKARADGELLGVINSFVPYPLIDLLEKNGAESYVEEKGGGLHCTWFLKRHGCVNTCVNPARNIVMHDRQSFSKLMDVYAETLRRCIDVRHLHMPMPMQTILNELAILPPSHTLYVRHKRIPFHLLEELAGREHVIHILEVSEGDVRLLIIGS